MNVIEQKFGTSTLRTEFITVHNNGQIVFNGAPIITVAQMQGNLKANGTRISMTVFDNFGCDAINVVFIFARKVEHQRSLYGAAKIVARKLYKILKAAGISEVTFFAQGKKRTPDAVKSGLELLQNLGIKIS